MAKKRNLWNLHSLATAYGQRPSNIIGLAPESWEAYQIDLCAFQLGRYVENKLEERDKQHKPLYRLEELLADPKPGGASQEYRSLAGLVKRKVQVRPDGTWD